MSRLDLYYRPHKALRALMADVLTTLDRTDPSDDGEVREAHARLEELLTLCVKHAALENEFIHRAIESRLGDGSCPFASAHLDHAAAIEVLRAATERRAPGLARQVSVFIAENLSHMEHEEREGNALLWKLFTDEELGAIEASLVASIPPGDKMQALRWMLPALNHPERVALLDQMRTAPPAVFEGMLAVARTHLKPKDFAKLEVALAQREPATLES